MGWVVLTRNGGKECGPKGMGHSASSDERLRVCQLRDLRRECMCQQRYPSQAAWKVSGARTRVYTTAGWRCGSNTQLACRRPLRSASWRLRLASGSGRVGGSAKRAAGLGSTPLTGCEFVSTVSCSAEGVGGGVDGVGYLVPIVVSATRLTLSSSTRSASICKSLELVVEVHVGGMACVCLCGSVCCARLGSVWCCASRFCVGIYDDP